MAILSSGSAMGHASVSPWHAPVFIIALGVPIFWYGCQALFRRGYAENASERAISFQDHFCFFDFERRWIRLSQSPFAIKIASALLMVTWFIGLCACLRGIRPF